MHFHRSRISSIVPCRFAALAILCAGCGSSLPPTGSSVEDNPALAASRGDAYSKAYDSKGKLKGVVGAASAPTARRSNSSMPPGLQGR